MESSSLVGFMVFALVSAFTPGPNNVMLTASGANFGFRRSLPHIIGITAGFCSLVLAGGFGLAALFSALPELYSIMKIASIAFLVYLAWRIANAGQTKGNGPPAPLTFWQAAAFQLVNPKSVAVITSSVSAYTSGAENLTGEVLALLVVFFVVTVGSTCTWCLFGTAIGRLIKNEKNLLRFNWLMAALLLASLVPILAQ